MKTTTALRQLLRQPGIIVAPGAYDCLTAKTGLDDTLRRCAAYAEAGADVLFVEALRTQAEIDRVRREVDLPLLYNFVEHGKSPLIPVPQLAALGFKLVIFPGSLLLSVYTLAQRILREIRQHGTTANLLGEMVSVVDLFNLMGMQESLALDAKWLDSAAGPPLSNARRVHEPALIEPHP